MAKVITFSRKFPTTHPRKGEPTYFVEQILNSLLRVQEIDVHKIDSILNYTLLNQFGLKCGIKKHTIRGGHRFKTGDYFSPRVWSGKPYCSPQITLIPDLKIQKVHDIVFVQKDKFLQVNGCVYEFGYEEMIEILAKNDGLSTDDFKAWFSKPFDGQIICWDDSVNY